MAEVVAHLAHALRERDAYLRTDDIRFFLRGMANPWWAVKHPLAAIHEIRNRRRYAA